MCSGAMPKVLGEFGVALHRIACRIDVSQGQSKSPVDANRAGESDRVVATLGDVQRSLRLCGEADDMLGRGHVTGGQSHLESDRVVVGSGGGRHCAVGVVAALLPALGVGLVDQGRPATGPGGAWSLGSSASRARCSTSSRRGSPGCEVFWLGTRVRAHATSSSGSPRLLGQGGRLAQRLDSLCAGCRPSAPGRVPNSTSTLADRLVVWSCRVRGAREPGRRGGRHRPARAPPWPRQQPRRV